MAKSAWKLFELTVSFPLASEKLTFSPSGRDLHNSDIFLAETVVSPSSIVSIKLEYVLICISKSVAVTSNFPSSVLSLKFAKMGIVCLLSATAAAFCKESTICDFSAVNFITLLYS